ncbi:unnamed protein product [Clavelina lepadiformis]|uniref:Uncharacterized protein n=1 Tax=Clavelina lepadiformis TaxID=159417 RepID=A0ABP0FKH8_CLALP
MSDNQFQSSMSQANVEINLKVDPSKSHLKGKNQQSKSLQDLRHGYEADISLTEYSDKEVLDDESFVQENQNAISEDINRVTTIPSDNPAKLLDFWVEAFKKKKQHLRDIAVIGFPASLSLFGIWLTNDQILAFCFVLKHVTKNIEMLDLSNCNLNKKSFHQIASAIKTLKSGQIANLNLIQNKLGPTNVDDIIGLLKVVKTQLDLAKSFDDGQGNFRDPSKSERIKILDVLDKMKDTNLKVPVGSIVELKRNRIRLFF